jgi:hypothetical protein
MTLSSMVIAILFAVQLTSCATTGKIAEERSRANQLDKSAADQKLTVASPRPEVITDSKASEFYRRHLDPKLIISEDDQKIIDLMLKQPTRSAWIDAAVFIGTLKRVNADQSSGQSFSESSLDTDSNNLAQKSAVKPSWEQYLTKKDINPLETYFGNILLQHQGVMVLLINTRSKLAVDSPDWISINKIILKNNEHYAMYLGTPNSQLPADQSNQSEENQIPLSPADINRADSILTESQLLADQKLYQAAIKRINEIQSTNPLYGEAQSRLRLLSNNAVQELRQRAALAYQKSVSVGDSVAKETYLQEARKHLQEALNQFPNADQLSVVKQNLDTIDREIDNIKLP